MLDLRRWRVHRQLMPMGGITRRTTSRTLSPDMPPIGIGNGRGRRSPKSNITPDRIRRMRGAGQRTLREGRLAVLGWCTVEFEYESSRCSASGQDEGKGREHDVEQAEHSGGPWSDRGDHALP